jgi:glycosyltransferase involved in cell wall biosynthesis
MKEKIIFILPFSSKAASSLRLLQLSKEFTNKLVIAPRMDQFGNKTEEKNIIKLKRSKLGISMIIPLVKIFKKENPKMIVYTKPTIFSVFSCFIYKLINPNVKIIADYDEFEPATSYSNNKGIAKIIKPAIHFFVHQLSNLIATAFIVSNKNILKFVPGNKPYIYLPNAANPNIIKPAKAKLHKKFSIYYFGNIYKNRQTVSLLELSNETDHQFVFAGRLYSPELKEEFPKVKFLGRYSLKEISKLASEADVLIAFFDKTPGNKYTSNMKVFDYMCLQKPIIVSDTGELKEYIHYPKGGYLARNKEELKKVIEYIRTHYKEAMQKAKYARKLAETIESWQARRKKFKRFVEKILKQN